MGTFVALFRGINVGGRNRLPMREVARVLDKLGATDVETYIQSGNAVFRTERRGTTRLASDVRAAIDERHGFAPEVLVMTVEQLRSAVEANPFPQAEREPKTLHLFFLDTEPDSPDLDALESARSKRERFRLRGRVFYLHAPDGIGRSKLVAKVERALGVPATARNWRTVATLLSMADAAND